MILVFDNRFVSEVHNDQEVGRSLKMFINRQGYTKCRVISSKNEVVFDLEDDILLTAMEPNPELQYSIMGLDGTVVCNNLKFINSKYMLTELT